MAGVDAQTVNRALAVGAKHHLLYVSSFKPETASAGIALGDHQGGWIHPLPEFQLKDDVITSLAISPEESHVLVGLRSGPALLIALRDGSVVRRYHVASKRLLEVAFCEGLDAAVFCPDSEPTVVKALEDGRTISTLPRARGEGLLSTVSANGRFVLRIDGDGNGFIVDLDLLRENRETSIRGAFDATLAPAAVHQLSRVAISDDGALVAAAGASRPLRL